MNNISTQFHSFPSENAPTHVSSPINDDDNDDDDDDNDGNK